MGLFLAIRFNCLHNRIESHKSDVAGVCLKNAGFILPTHPERKISPMRVVAADPRPTTARPPRSLQFETLCGASFNLCLSEPLIGGGGGIGESCARTPAHQSGAVRSLVAATQGLLQNRAGTLQSRGRKAARSRSNAHAVMPHPPRYTAIDLITRVTHPAEDFSLRATAQSRQKIAEMAVMGTNRSGCTTCIFKNGGRRAKVDKQLCIETNKVAHCPVRSTRCL